LVHESIFDDFVERVATHVADMRVGDPLDEQTDIGALINRAQFDRVSAYIEEGLRDGTAAVGGLPPDDGTLSSGYFHVPTIITDIDPRWRIVREEVFGPVLVALPWRDEAEALALANDTHYGLAAYVWTDDVATAFRVAHAIDAGWVQVNRGGGILAGMSYGGIKQSGLGKEYSLEGALEDFTHRKSVTFEVPQPS
jgi:betaine-aldehyde dehydrogenase